MNRNKWNSNLWVTSPLCFLEFILYFVVFLKFPMSFRLYLVHGFSEGKERKAQRKTLSFVRIPKKRRTHEGKQNMVENNLETFELCQSPSFLFKGTTIFWKFLTSSYFSMAKITREIVFLLVFPSLFFFLKLNPQTKQRLKSGGKHWGNFSISFSFTFSFNYLNCKPNWPQVYELPKDMMIPFSLHKMKKLKKYKQQKVKTKT